MCVIRPTGIVLILTWVFAVVHANTINENGRDFTLVLKPEQDTNWTQIRHWAKQHGIPLESIDEDAFRRSQLHFEVTQNNKPQSLTSGYQSRPRSDSQVAPRRKLATERASVLPGPAFMPMTASSQRDGHKISRKRQRIRPGPAQRPGSRRVSGRRNPTDVQPGPALVLSRNSRVPNSAREPTSMVRGAMDTASRHSEPEENDGESIGQIMFQLEPVVDTVPPPPQNLRMQPVEEVPSDTGEQGEESGDLPRSYVPIDGTNTAVYADESGHSKPRLEKPRPIPTQSDGPLGYPGAQIPEPPVVKQEHRVIHFTPDAGPSEAPPMPLILPQPTSRPAPVAAEAVTESARPAIQVRHHAPDVLATLLQRLEDRLVAAESLQRQQAAQLQNLQHSRRKQAVSAAEQREDIRIQFDNLEHKTGNLQTDINRVSSLLEAVLGEVRAVGRLQRQRPASGAASGDSDADQLHETVQQLSEQLGQLATTAEQLRSAHRHITGSLRSLRNSTRDMVEQSDQCATEEMMIRSAADTRSFIQQQLAMNYQQRQADEDEANLPGDCSEAQLAPANEDGAGVARPRSGVHQVWPRGAPQPFLVVCDMDTDGGGWTVIQRRDSGEQDFFQDWVSYKHGFGSLTGEFWLGNEHIHQITNHRPNSLRVELSDFARERPGFPAYPGSNATATYTSFALASELQGYALRVLDGYSGDAGDSLRYHAGARFSTKDVDHDLWEENSCARAHKGGWWYKGCDSSNLNGQYLSGPVPAEYEYQGVYWHDWRGPRYSLYRTAMMVRPSDHLSRLQQAGGFTYTTSTEEAMHDRSSQKTKRRKNRRKKGRHGRT